MSTLTLLQFILYIVASSGINDYVGDNETFWESMSIFTPGQQSSISSYGHIIIGHALQMELTVTWNGRATNSDDELYEQFFEIFGLSDARAHISDDENNIDNHNHASTYYPSLYLQPTRDAFHVCVLHQHYNLNHPTLAIGHSYAVVIEFNASTLSVSINAERVIEIDSSALFSDEYIDESASIYWFGMRNDAIAAGDANIADIRIVSHLDQARSDATMNADEYTFGWIIYSLFALPALCVFGFCCCKSRQLRRQMEKAILEQSNNHESTNAAGPTHTGHQAVARHDEEDDEERGGAAEFAQHFDEDDDDASLPSYVQPMHGMQTQAQGKPTPRSRAEHPNEQQQSMSHSPMRNNMATALRLATEHSYNSYGPGHGEEHMHMHGHGGSYGHRKSPRPAPNPQVYSAATSATSELFAPPPGSINKKSPFGALHAATPDSTSEFFAPVKSPSAKHGLFDATPYKHVGDMLVIHQHGEPSDRAPDLEDYQWISDMLKNTEPRRHDQYLARFMDEGLADAKIRSLRHFEKTLQTFKS